MKWNKNFKKYVEFLRKKLKFDPLFSLKKIYAIYRHFDVIEQIHWTSGLSCEELSQELGIQTFAIRNKIRELKDSDVVHFWYEKRTPMYVTSLTDYQYQILKTYTRCARCFKRLTTRTVFLFVNKVQNVTKVFCSAKCRSWWCFNEHKH